MGGLALDEAKVRDLKARLRGEVLQPGGDGYDAARTVWNAMIDRRPAVVARCASAADVVAAVAFAREHDLPLSVRGGGHNVAGHAVAERGLMLDLSRMTGDPRRPARRTARAEPGLTWGQFDRETHAFGLATTGWVVVDDGHRRSDPRAGAWAGCCAGTGWPSTTCSPRTSSPRTGRCVPPAPRSTLTSSGPCAGAGATSAWSPPSSTACTR